MTEPLPTVVAVNEGFARRWPSPRLQHVIRDVEGMPFQQVIGDDPSRVTAFRALVRDFPDYDLTALWLHSYDVEVAVVEVDPTPNGSPRAGPPSATIGAAGPTT